MFSEDFSTSMIEFLAKRNVDVNSTKWKLKRLLGYVVYTLLLVFYIPFFLLGVSKWASLILGLKIKRGLGMRDGNIKGELGIASRKHKVIDMCSVDTVDELDFLINRSFGYIWRMCFWTPWDLALYFLKEQRIKLISDGQLAYVVLCTVFGHSVTWDESRKMFRLSMEGIEDLQLFEGFYWDAREIFVSEDGKKIIIKMLEGDEYHSDCEPHLRPTFDLAKLHAQICLSFMGPGLSHNDVHFLFPSSMAVLSKRHLDHDKVLFKLLSPHFRFTERINYQALRVQKATNNKRSTLDRLFFFWQPFPVIKEVFREAIAKKCKEHYLEKGAQECDAGEYEIACEEDSKRVGEDSSDNAEQKIRRTHTLFPPDYITDKSRQKVPYLKFFAEYYKVIRRYVQDLEPFIDKDEWHILSEELAKYVPNFNKVEMIDAIASFILKVGVVHFSDHESYVRYFSYKYACMSMRSPFEPFENEKAWDDDILESAKRDPIALIRQQDVLRTRCFLNIFVDFIANPKCNLCLADTNYDFEHFGPQMAEKNFKERLKQLDEKLKSQPLVANVPDAQGIEDRAIGMQILPLESIINTVCY